MWIFSGNNGSTEKIFHGRHCETKVGELEKYSSAFWGT